jgi:putative MATE family efflux protein
MNITEDPIPQIIRRIAIPASVGFFFNTMYNFVDTYFGGKISTDALAALSLSFPVFFIILSAGSGIGQGATALISNSLGAGDEKKASVYFTQAILFSVICGLVITVVGFLISPSLFRLLGATDAYLEIALDYMNWIVAGTVFFILQTTLNSVLNAKGETKVFRNTLLGGFVLNCVLDPWFLYGGFGVPAMGIAGIAIATVVVQIAGCIYIFNHVRKMSLWSGLSASNFRPIAHVQREIVGQAIPASLNMLTVAVGIFVITWFVSRFSKEGVAAYGIATRIEQMILLPTIGLNFAVLTLVGQNNGAGRMDRVKTAWLTTMKYGISLMLAGGVILFFTREPLMKLFTSDVEVIQRGVDYLGIAMITLCAYVVLFQTVFMLQGLKQPMFGLWIGLYRQVVAPIIVFNSLAFAMGWGLWGIWWGIFCVTWSAALITLYFGIRALRKSEAVSLAPLSTDA